MEFSEIIKYRIQDMKESPVIAETVLSNILYLVHMDENDPNQGEVTFKIFNEVMDKSFIETQKFAIELLNLMIQNHLIKTDVVKDLINELTAIKNENSTLMDPLKNIIDQLILIESGHLNSKITIQEMILKIEYGTYLNEDILYSVLNILSDIKPSYLANENEVSLLKSVILHNIVIEDESYPVVEYLLKISRMDHILVHKIYSNLDMSEHNPVIKAIAQTLAFAKEHNDLQKKFQYSVVRLPEISSFIDVNERITMEEFMTFIIEAIVTKYNQNKAQDILSRQQTKKEDQVISLKSKINDLILKYNEYIARKFNFYNFTENEIKRNDFDYKRYLKEINDRPLNDLADCDENIILLFLSVILGDIETLNHMNHLEEIINNRHPGTGYTPFMVACQFGKLEIVKFLIAHSANIHYTHFETKKNGISLAVENNHIEVANYLFSHGVNDLNRNLLSLAYQNNTIDMAKMVDHYYLHKIKFGSYKIRSIIELFIENIAFGSYFEIFAETKKYKKHKKAVTACKNMLNNTIHPQEVIGLIDFTRFKKMKEGMVFTTKGVFIKFSKNKKVTKIYQPYLILEEIDFENNTLTIKNSITNTKEHDYDVLNHYTLVIPQINNNQLYKLFYTVSDVFNRMMTHH